MGRAGLGMDRARFGSRGNDGISLDGPETGVVGIEDKEPDESEDDFASASQECVSDAEGIGETGEAAQEENTGFLCAEGSRDPEAEDFDDAGEGFDDEGLGPRDGHTEQPGDEIDFEGVKQPAAEIEACGGEEPRALGSIEPGDGLVELDDLGPVPV